MTQKHIAFAVVGVLVLGGIAFMATRPSDKTGTETLQTQNETTNTPSGSESKKTLREMISSGESRKCTLSQAISGNNVLFTIYVGNNKMRWDMSVEKTATSPAMTSSVIMDNDFMYAWSSAANYGIKSPIGAAGQQVDPNFDLDAQHAFDCSGWNVDGGVFTPPANVTFTQYGVMPQ